MTNDHPSTANSNGSTTDEVSEAVEEIAARLAAGERIDVDSVCDKYPQARDRIFELLPTIVAVSALESSDSHPADFISHARFAGGYSIKRELGRGGMGIVYLGEEQELGRQVAIKVLPIAALLDQRQLERFKNEARAAATLRHPNIVAVHAIGSDHGVNFYVMDFVDGLSLGEIIERAGYENISTNNDRSRDNISPEIAALTIRSSSRVNTFYASVARVGKQAAEALHHAHESGVIHRDIKPSNLLIDNRANVHIADFGLARVQSGSNLTRTGDVVGTLRYISPEQLDGCSDADQRSDVYSLGMTL